MMGTRVCQVKTGPLATARAQQTTIRLHQRRRRVRRYAGSGGSSALAPAAPAMRPTMAFSQLPLLLAPRVFTRKLFRLSSFGKFQFQRLTGVAPPPTRALYEPSTATTCVPSVVYGSGVTKRLCLWSVLGSHIADFPSIVFARQMVKQIKTSHAGHARLESTRSALARQRGCLV
jgi:hypothetical protein